MANIELKVTLLSGSVISYNYVGDVTTQIIEEIKDCAQIGCAPKFQVRLSQTACVADRIKGIKGIRALTNAALAEAKRLSDVVTEENRGVVLPGSYTKNHIDCYLGDLRQGFTVDLIQVVSNLPL